MRLERRALLKAVALSPFWLLARVPRAEAADYASAADALAAIDTLEADVAARLRLIAAGLAQARTLVASFLADHARHRAARARVRRRLRLAPPPPLSEAISDDASLDGLRAQQEALVYAHAEAMPALGDAQAVDAFSKDMIDLARQLTVIDLWLEAEAERG